MSRIVDYAVVGAGCSGLSLASELAAKAPADSRLALIDSRKTYTMDRIWCYWDVFSHRFSTAASHSWNQWKVRYNGEEVLATSDRYPYHMVPADAFYKTAFRQIELHPGFQMHLGTPVDRLIEEDNLVRIASGNDDIKARHVFDGRLLASRVRHWDCLLQHYGGQFVETSRPAFDPATITLMDFDVPQDRGIAFVYVLPFSERRALIEPTFFSYQALGAQDYHDCIRAYLKERYGVDRYSVSFTEQGIIPLRPYPVESQPSSRVHRIGTLGGMVKGSTGYGFLAIQKSSPALVEGVLNRSISDGQHPRSAFSMWLDAVFLHHIEQYPGRAPDIFFNLFKRVRPDALVRFLSDMATPSDYAEVIWAMPKWPLTRTAYDYVFNRSQSWVDQHRSKNCRSGIQSCS